MATKQSDKIDAAVKEYLNSQAKPKTSIKVLVNVLYTVVVAGRMLESMAGSVLLIGGALLVLRALFGW